MFDPMEKMKNLNPQFPEKEFFVNQFGENVYAVGGFVRNLIRKKPSKEVDILVTHHSVDSIVQKLKSYGKVDLVGKSFGVIKFTIQGRTYDIALPRKDRPKPTFLPGHKDILVSADPEIPIQKDLKRRDFRCNSIALRLKDGKIIDPFGGQKDIRNQIIRLTDPQSFPEDPLRVIRVARFASVLNFSVDPQIYEISKNIKLKGLSVERINEELFKILLSSPQPSLGLEELFKLDALRQLFPEIYALTLSIQDSIFHPEKDRFGHHTVWHHTKLTVDQAKRLADRFGLDRERKLALLLAALYHDVGKPSTAKWEFKRGRMTITNNRHDVVSEKLTEKALSRFKIFSWNGFNIKKMVLALIRCHHRTSELWQNRGNVTKKAFNRLAADIDGEIELLVYLDAADRTGRTEKPSPDLDEPGKWLLNKFEEFKVSKETIQPLVMGRDLLQLGVAPGPKMGQILDKLYQLQLDNEFETREEGLQTAKKIIQKEKEKQE